MLAVAAAALAGALLAALLASLLLRRRPAIHGTRRPPGPWQFPLVGDSLAALRDPVALRERRHARYGPVYASVFLGRR
jgi:hypothetical protein